MTKIYLVTFENKYGTTWDFQAFTNLRKAKNYQRYWNAVMTNRPDMYDGDKTKIRKLTINYLDYEKYAVKEEMKNLPY